MRKFCCGVDWQYERDLPSFKYSIFDTITQLKAISECWKECGIVELEIGPDLDGNKAKLIRWAEPSNFYQNRKK